MENFFSQDSTDSESNYTTFTEPNSLPPLNPKDYTKYVGMRYENAEVQFRAEYGFKGYSLKKCDIENYHLENFRVNTVRMLVIDGIVISTSYG